MQVGSALAVAEDVDALDVLDLEHRALDASQHHAHLGEHVVWQVARAVDVYTRLEDQHDRQAAGRKGLQPPALVCPEVLVVALAARGARAGALTVAVGLVLGRAQRLGRDTADERPGVPLLDRRRSQTPDVGSARILGVLGHSVIVGVQYDRFVEWPEQWYAWRAGDGCPSCAEGRPDELPMGIRFFAGDVADAYLVRADIQRGLSIVVWRGRHVVEPTELSDEEAAAYGREVLAVGRALEGTFSAVKLNYNVLGNSLPHLHTHIVPRYADDPRPGWPFPFSEPDPGPMPEERVARDVAALRAALAQ